MKLHNEFGIMKVVKKIEDSESISFIPILQKLVERFPKKFKYKKELGLQYSQYSLSRGMAINIFEDILDKNDSLVKAHLGKKLFKSYNIGKMWPFYPGANHFKYLPRNTLLEKMCFAL